MYMSINIYVCIYHTFPQTNRKTTQLLKMDEGLEQTLHKKKKSKWPVSMEGYSESLANREMQVK